MTQQCVFQKYIDIRESVSERYFFCFLVSEKSDVHVKISGFPVKLKAEAYVTYCFCGKRMVKNLVTDDLPSNMSCNQLKGISDEL